MPTVLLIDDDPHVRDAISVILKLRHFGVFVAPDGSTGIELFRTSGFDAVVVDIFMPEMEGLATIRRLRAINPFVPIIAISGHVVTLRREDRPDFLGMAVRLGASCALQKPFEAEALLAAINQCLGRGRDAGNAAPPPREPRRAEATMTWTADDPGSSAEVRQFPRDRTPAP